MQIIATLRKRTKTGISVWNFCYNAETKQHFAVGGEALRGIPADDRAHLRQIYQSFVRYGYAEKLATPKRQWISDPWASELPSDMQQKLELLSA